MLKKHSLTNFLVTYLSPFKKIFHVRVPASTLDEAIEFFEKNFPGFEMLKIDKVGN